MEQDTDAVRKEQFEAFKAYLAECEENSTVPNTAGAFNYAWQAASKPVWQSIESAPPSTSVFVHYKNELGKSRVIKAIFHPKFTATASDEGYEPDDAEYNEEKDEFYVPEGWYEIVENWPDYSYFRAYIEPTYWQPITLPPENNHG